MTKHILIYNPEDVQLGRIHEFATVKSSWGEEIIAEIDGEYDDEEMLEWLREWTFNTDIVANICDIERPDQLHKFQDVYPRSTIKDLIERESPGGDIRKYTTDIYLKQG